MIGFGDYLPPAGTGISVTRPPLVAVIVRGDAKLSKPRLKVVGVMDGFRFDLDQGSSRGCSWVSPQPDAAM